MCICSCRTTNFSIPFKIYSLIWLYTFSDNVVTILLNAKVFISIFMESKYTHNLHMYNNIKPTEQWYNISIITNTELICSC